MKIAFLVNQFPRLSETFILNQITGLIDRGHEIDIFSYKPADIIKIHPDVEKYDLLKRTYYYETMPKNKFLRVIKGIYPIMINFHKKPMVILRSLNVLKYGKEAASLGLLYKIIPILDKNPYDIIHCHFGPNGKLGILLKEIGAISGKCITSFHGYDMSDYIRSHGNHTYDHLFKKGDLFLPISERWKEELIRLGCSGQKIIVHRMGIDTDNFTFRARIHRKDGRVKLLTIARLVEKKGVQYGIQAVAKVLKKYPGIEYRIVGDGPLKNTLEHLVKELNINKNVTLLGWKQQEEIIELMKDADILLAPSVTGENGDQEGIPVVLMEAMAQGLPVISTYHSGIPELVQDGESGFLVPERDISALSDRLEYLIDHPEIWFEMGKAGRKHVEENFDIDKLNDRLVDLYQQLINGKPLNIHVN